MAVVWSLSVILAGLLLFYTNGVHADLEEWLGSPFVQTAVNEAIKSVDKAYAETRGFHKEQLHTRSLTPGDLLRFFKQPLAETKVAVRAAEYTENVMQQVQQHIHRIHKRSFNASDLLSPNDLDIIAKVTGCQAVRQPPVCADDCWSNRYRTFTSICNNRLKPRLGASNTALTRWLPAKYEDGISLPLGWTPNKLHAGFAVPLVREVSNRILKVSNKDVVSDETVTGMFMQWGQWIDHDMSLSPVSGSIQTFNGGINCERTCVQRSPCFPIEIPHGDTRIKDTKTCMPFFRSAPACGTGELGTMFGDVNTRQQINSLTSFLDVNEVYGSTDCLANKLRNLTNELGLLAVNQEFSDNGREYLPFNTISSNLCGGGGEGCATGRNATPCFLGGDVRVNEQLGLLSFHTIFLREHNRIARELKRMNPHWSGDTTYHETRKILGAFQQIINHRDYAPQVIGTEATEKYLSEYEGYNESVNPSIANVFSTAAFRFGHLSIQPILVRMAENFQEHPEFPNLPLHETFFTPWRIIKQGGADPIVRGLLGFPAKLQKSGKMLPDELREKLFKLSTHLALDLGALNMQRSRDHGLQGYNAWRKFCGLSQPNGHFQLSQVLQNSDLAEKFLKLYGTVENIDVWIGAISEPFVKGGKIGPLLACLIGQQFKNLRDGDRFWWENPGVFTHGQRQALTQISMSRIICDNTGIQFLPQDAFKFHHFPQGYVNCTKIPQVDLSAWREDTQAVGEETPNGTGPSSIKGEKGDTGSVGPKGECVGSLQQTKISAFSVRLTSRNLRAGRPFPCSTEIYNGQKDYDCQTGIFTSRIHGVYQFSYNCETRNQAIVFLKKNRVSVITSRIFDRKSQNILSGSTILELNAGDHVWLEPHQKLNGFSDSCYFQGHLIFAV
ncbi:eosinophil peroxidase-like isoform X2 [Pristis pectinata]|uniref:eosinophil peroxidase-like isoform X2 n=1 Tax=Pristis pectinata TaxID=685728 RepID=UPI00223D5AD3|nr:eosinophil peroxidase-like isoform X2 [Pristis pectinata]